MYKHSLGDIVYLKTDCDQRPRIVTGIHIRPDSISYSLSLGDNESTHYELEISQEYNVLSKIMS